MKSEGPSKFAGNKEDNDVTQNLKFVFNVVNPICTHCPTEPQN